MADPHIVLKVIEEREEQIRPCVGATFCLDGIYENGEALCVHNAATGREAIMPHKVLPAEKHRKIIVIGAGPAGLEAARVAGERGHEVTVLKLCRKPAGRCVDGKKQTAARFSRSSGLAPCRIRSTRS